MERVPSDALYRIRYALYYARLARCMEFWQLESLNLKLVLSIDF